MPAPGGQAKPVPGRPCSCLGRGCARAWAEACLSSRARACPCLTGCPCLYRPMPVWAGVSGVDRGFRTMFVWAGPYSCLGRGCARACRVVLVPPGLGCARVCRAVPVSAGLCPCLPGYARVCRAMPVSAGLCPCTGPCPSGPARARVWVGLVLVSEPGRACPPGLGRARAVPVPVPGPCRARAWAVPCPCLGRAVPVPGPCPCSCLGTAVPVSGPGCARACDGSCPFPAGLALPGTVRERDLGGLPGPLRHVIASCLAEDPVGRARSSRCSRSGRPRHLGRVTGAALLTRRAGPDRQPAYRARARVCLRSGRAAVGAVRASGDSRTGGRWSSGGGCRGRRRVEDRGIG
ncbi:hypothetical protein HNP84_004295 [Thermocatellispora tengchongensis]|uniref:Uncharacterized protein n=1 Tax=Thermocatellispora tengchongensis TaxID=1073253 RepID=A0A840P9H2_9ACTN|nr:hypothetical protein [Thermocatellispora tengchongensis]